MLELATHEPRFEELAKRFEPATLYTWIDILSKTQQEMRFSNHTKIYMETALLKMAQADVPVQSTASAVSPELEAKVIQLENLVRELQQQVQNGAGNGAAAAPAEQKKRQRVQSSFKIPTGRIQDVLKNATKVDIQAIKTNWATVMSQLQRSHSALLNDAEPVAA